MSTIDTAAIRAEIGPLAPCSPECASGTCWRDQTIVRLCNALDGARATANMRVGIIDSARRRAERAEARLAAIEALMAAAESCSGDPFDSGCYVGVLSQKIRAALASVPSRYDQCDGTCTADCGHCKGQGRPADGGAA